MKYKVIFSTPIYSTLNKPRLCYALELIKNIKKQFGSRNYLHIIVDDGSTDNAGKILKKMTRKNPNLIVINHKHVDGTFAFNLGIDISVNPEKHQTLLSPAEITKINKFNADLINWTGVDDLIGPNMNKVFKQIDNYSKSTVGFWGNYYSFSANYPFVHSEIVPWKKNLKDYFRMLFFVENFPSHIQYFRPSFIREIINTRGFEIGILDPSMWSPINYELNLFITKYAIEHGYNFGFLKGNFGYKRYNITGTMTTANKKSGRYVKERLEVFKKYNPILNTFNSTPFKNRPIIKQEFFRKLNLNDSVVFDPYLEKIITETKKL